MTTVLQELAANTGHGVAGLALQSLTSVSLVVGTISWVETMLLETSGLFLRPQDSTQWVNGVRHRSPDHSATRFSPVCLSSTLHAPARRGRSWHHDVAAPSGKDWR